MPANFPDVESPASWSDLLVGRNGLQSIVLAGGVGLHATNVYIVTTVLPSIISDIGGLSYYAWATSLFVIMSIVASSLASRLTNQVGHRNAFLLALLVFSLGSAGCALAPNMGIFLIARAVQGFGGGTVVSLSYAMIRIMFPPALWSRAMALMSGMWGVSTLSGPAIGGIFSQAGNWRSAFWILLPIAVVLAFLLQFALKIPTEKSAEVKSNNIPIIKIITLASSVLVISAASLVSNIMLNIGGIITSIVLITLIARFEEYGGTRLLPTGAFSLGSLIGSLYITMILMILGLTTEIYIPYFLQIIHGYSPLLAGYLTGVMSCGWTLAALLCSSYSGNYAKFFMKSGSVIIFIGLISLSVILPSATILDRCGLLPLCFSLILVGFGIGMGMPHIMANILASAHPNEAKLASYSLTTVQLFATAVGAALGGMVTSLAGLTESGGSLVETTRAAQWLFISFSVSPLLAFFSMHRVLKFNNALAIEISRTSS